MDWMHILSIAGRVLLVVLLVGLVIFVHELGHFLAARRLGLVVDVFSLGFGPALWKRKIGGIEYRISSIPLGGYVAIPQLDPAGMETVQGEHKPEGGKRDQEQEPPRELPPAPPWKRILVAIAGPLGNVVLAVVLAWVIYLTPHAVTGGASTVIGAVETNSPAWHAGLRAEQVIARVNGNRVATWYDFMIECHLIGDPAQGVTLTVNDGGAVCDLHVPLTKLDDSSVNLSVVAGLIPKSRCLVSEVFSNSVAEAGGLKAGDTLQTINGMPIPGHSSFKMPWWLMASIRRSSGWNAAACEWLSHCCRR
jgi:regulator of sigma E protease